jgi:predicted SAM-dependent methyltransferase
MSLDRYSHNIMVGTNYPKVHPLLSRLHKTKKDLFYITNKGYTDLSRTSTNKLITELESLKSSN